jgi:hypothetical protein
MTMNTLTTTPVSTTIGGKWGEHNLGTRKAPGEPGALTYQPT